MNIQLSGAVVGVDAVQYASGDLLGSKLDLGGMLASHGQNVPILTDITIHDLSKQNAPMDLILFDGDPAATTFTNNAALDVADADLPRVLGKVSISAGDYVSLADNSVATLAGLALAVKASAANRVYACLVCRGTPTYAANELGLSLGFVL